MTDCSNTSLAFARLGTKQVVADFHGGRLTTLRRYVFGLGTAQVLVTGLAIWGGLRLIGLPALAPATLGVAALGLLGRAHASRFASLPSISSPCS